MIVQSIFHLHMIKTLMLPGFSPKTFLKKNDENKHSENSTPHAAGVPCHQLNKESAKHRRILIG